MLVFGMLVLIDIWCEVVCMVNVLVDRVLVGFVLVIVECVLLDENGLIVIEIFYGVLEMLSFVVEDWVFYCVDGLSGWLVIGYVDLFMV